MYNASFLGPRNKPQKPYCKQPRDPGPCKGSHLRWYYDPDMDQCKLFYYGGCQGNKNNFGTNALCENECLICKSLLEVGTLPSMNPATSKWAIQL